ncbi:restriction endonuclease subunit S [Thalassospira xiamenensis]|uniref:restriction endonuclease subunit S n=1 Tax=Thalassospira xiamenensis TaxID=220697 RepID=UPI001FFF8CD7|nr:restriction endonuclease subunit S [Thalassospira xiamenensis]MCK2168134.1 restriction endonuclease subunit S [Thalassospira xiamenensis]
MTHALYDKYKDSNIGWLGAVPSHWKVTPLFAIASERSEKNFGMQEDNLLSLSYGHIVEKSIETLDGLLPASFETYQIVYPDDIVMRLTDLQNDKRSLRSAIVKAKGIITSAYLALNPRTVNPAFLSYLLRAYDLTKVFYSMGGGLRQSMKFTDVKRLPILLPEPVEQALIAKFLDRETAKIDDLVAEQERLIALLKEKRQAVISHAVTKGLNRDVPMKDSGVEWLGEIPAHWEQLRFKDVCSEIVDCKNRTPDKKDNGQYFVVRTSCVRDGKFDSRGGYFTDEESFIEWTKKGRPSSDDVLFTREAPTGEACIAPENLSFCLGQRMMYLRPDKEKTSAEFLLQSVYGPLVRSVVESKSRGSTVGHLRVGEIGELPLLLPPIDEQILIVEAIANERQKLDELYEKAQDAMRLLSERRAALVSAAVTGKIDVRGLVDTEEAA